MTLLLLTGGSVFADFVDGIDVSHWQGTINWTSVKNSGVDFAFMKATQGNSYIDPTFQTNITNATAAGVLVGPYHFCDVDTDINNPLDPVNEANHFLSLIEPYYETGLCLPPVADVEGLPDFPTIAEERAFISNWVQVFSDTINDSLGVRPIIYTSKWGANTYYTPSVAASHNLWLAWWKGTGTSNPPVSSDTPLWNEWKFWQYSSTGDVPGIGGHVDLDVFDGTLEQLEQLTMGAEPSDFNSDGSVDGEDLSIWQLSFGMAQAATPDLGDTDGDTDVDGADFLHWQIKVRNAATEQGLTSVPEPTSAVLLILSALFLALWFHQGSFGTRARLMRPF